MGQHQDATWPAFSPSSSCSPSLRSPSLSWAPRRLQRRWSRRPRSLTCPPRIWCCSSPPRTRLTCSPRLGKEKKRSATAQLGATARRGGGGERREKGGDEKWASSERKKGVKKSTKFLPKIFYRIIYNYL